MKLSVKIDGQSFEVSVGDLNARPIEVLVDGETFEIWPEETAQSVRSPAPARPGLAPLPAAPMQIPDAAEGVVNKTRCVTAPIPGVIVSVRVKAGDTVAFGQELCVLEAMKMKNQIRANRAGKIAMVCAAVGEQVQHGQVLMEYTD